ncbi:MAG: glycosyltransferase family 2 protein [Candidatus Poribacteria bacterium]|nr:glycosyltransferase family 2 protein [Candidatus Poribacteria bacterium]
MKALSFPAGNMKTLDRLEGGTRLGTHFDRKLNSDAPLVSVITICLNAEKTLEQTIQSVINQTYNPIEFLIIDGGSTDSTLDIIRKYDNQIDYWVSEPDGGTSDAINKGIQLSCGALIGILCADDFYEKGAVETIIGNYSADTPKIYHGDMTRIDVHTGEKTFLLKPPEDLGRMFQGCAVNTPATFVDRRIFEKHGLFNRDYKFADDHEFLLRSFSLGVEFNYVPQNITFMREGGRSQKHYIRACWESFNLSIRYGGAVPKTLFVFLITVLKKAVERRIAKWCPPLLKRYNSLKILSLKNSTWHGN